MPPVLKFTQPAGDFYLTRLPAIEVLRISRASPRKYDPTSHTSVGGVQREATKKRINEIAEYCQTADAAFPTAVILAVPEQHYQLSPDESTIEFNGAAPFEDN